jgi:hypothetical protein
MQGSLDAPPIVVRTSRAKSSLLFAVCAAFVAGGGWSIATGHGFMAYASAGFFALGMIVFAAQLLWPGSLEIGPGGVRCQHLGRNAFYGWWQMRDFKVWSAGGLSRQVFFQFRRKPDGGFLPGSFAGSWEMPAQELCAVLDAAHARWAGQ